MHKTDTPEKVRQSDELGQLPEPVDLLQAVWRGDREFMRLVGDYYNADQMRAYAAGQVAADRERWQAAAQLVLSQIDALPHDMRRYVTGYVALENLV